MLSLADNFLAGSILTLAMPVGLVIALLVWYLVATRRVPVDTPESSLALPPDEVVAAARDTVHEVTPVDPPAGQP